MQIFIDDEERYYLIKGNEIVFGPVSFINYIEKENIYYIYDDIYDLGELVTTVYLNLDSNGKPLGIMYNDMFESSNSLNPGNMNECYHNYKKYIIKKIRFEKKQRLINHQKEQEKVLEKRDFKWEK